MARYTGPKAKISRRFREPILGAEKTLQKKNYPPGQHGKSRSRKSAYAIQLNEKQKAKYLYGILERPMRNLYKKACEQKGITGHILLQYLELRLDNIVYRLGIAKSRRTARQLVSHKHIMVDGKTVNIPSYRVRVDSTIAIHPKAQKMTIISEQEDNDQKPQEWLTWDANTFTGKVLQVPQREQITENINEQAIVELYSK